MKLRLLLLPLLISMVSCVDNNNTHSNPTNANSGTIIVDNDNTKAKQETIYQNVGYGFDYEKKCYLIYVFEQDKSFEMPPTNLYCVYVNEYIKIKDTGVILENEYYKNANELFVYKLL